MGHFKFETPPLRAQRYQRISMTGICSVRLLYQDAPPFTAETESSILLSPVPSRGPDTRSPGLRGLAEESPAARHRHRRTLVGVSRE